eukprot:311566-Chlamydomonas_euryale.AAC.1
MPILSWERSEEHFYVNVKVLTFRGKGLAHPGAPSPGALRAHITLFVRFPVPLPTPQVCPLQVVVDTVCRWTHTPPKSAHWLSSHCTPSGLEAPGGTWRHLEVHLFWPGVTWRHLEVQPFQAMENKDCHARPPRSAHPRSLPPSPSPPRRPGAPLPGPHGRGP